MIEYESIQFKAKLDYLSKKKLRNFRNTLLAPRYRKMASPTTLTIKIYYIPLPVQPLQNHQQNKWYPQRCLLAHFEATLDFCRSEFTCP